MPPLEAVGLVLFAIWLCSLVFHIGSVVAALAQARCRRGRAANAGPRPPVSIIVPTRETDPAFRLRLAELANLTYPAFEIVVASDRSEPAVEAAIAALAPERAKRVRVSIDGTRHTFNPKVNVEVAAYRIAAHDLILLTDDNVRSPPDRIDSLLPYLAGDVGLVSAVAIGVEPQGLAAEIEATFMNGYGARFLLATDRLGRSIAMGKTLLFRRSDLERAGGILALAQGMAEDSVIRERLAAIGLETALAPTPALQPLGRRRFADMFARQLRWMAARRWHTPLAFWTELLLGWVLAGVMAGFAAELLLGRGFIPGFALTWALWLGLDLACTRALGWPVFWRYPLAWTLRELLLPPMWLLTLVKRSVAWRGNEVPLRPRIAALGQD
jgi:ceramide glucosyltransferase